MIRRTCSRNNALTIGADNDMHAPMVSITNEKVEHELNLMYKNEPFWDSASSIEIRK